MADSRRCNTSQKRMEDRRYKAELKKKKDDMERDREEQLVDMVTRTEERKKVLKQSLARLKARQKKAAPTRVTSAASGGKEGKRKRKEEREKRVAEKRGRIAFLH